jgi:hypothetical protein
VAIRGLGFAVTGAAYAFEIKAAHHRRLDWQRIFYNDILFVTP